MGRRRKPGPKKKKKQPKSFWEKLFDEDKPIFSFDIHEQAAKEITAISLALIAVFFLLSLIGRAGSFGLLINDFLRGIFGLSAFILPILFIGAAYEFFKPKNSGVRLTGFLGAIFLTIFFPALLHQVWPGDAQALAEASSGGGLVGYWLSQNLAQAVGSFVGLLILIGMTIISLILLSNVSLAQLFGLKAKQEGGEDVQINQLGKAPVFETIRRIGFGRNKTNAQSPTPVVAPPQPLNQPSALTSASSLGYQLPSTELLENSDVVAESGDIAKNVEKIQKTLKDFGINVSMGEVNVGPTVTQYTCKPSEGVKLNQITARANDLALSLAAKSIRIEAPIPGKAAVGIEVPNMVRAKVTIREILETKDFSQDKTSLAVALGRDVAGSPSVVSIENMPHLLVAGSTGSGKSVAINTVILSLLFRNTPEDLRFIMVDPKRVELTGYNHLPHLLTPVITESDKTVSALKWAVSEMDRRYRLFSETGSRNIQSFNESLPSGQQRMPKIVIIIDELADLMSVAAREVEATIVRLAQMARATGIHLLVATQRPSVDVITGLIKANITTRIAFATATQADSRTILDMGGAEKLLGLGDMLFVSADSGKPRRVQGAFASDKDINNVIAHVRTQGMAQYNDEIVATTATVGAVAGQAGGGAGGGVDEDELYNDAVAIVKEAHKASASLLQRRLRIGYARAARLLDILEDQGVIGPGDGARPREVYGERGGGATSGAVSQEDNSSNNIQPYN